VGDCCLTPNEQFSAVSWQEQVIFIYYITPPMRIFQWKNMTYHSIHVMSNTLGRKGYHDDRTEYASQLNVNCRDDIKFNLSR